ncbi:alpha/beta fold hydrolase [Paraburkholderia caribensis]|uniref:alpha/beta fold hydrolase n=1 Tax=Paraburkholderia caribensis TaxID=75105 RepID=UPI0006880FF4|nr:alpha/beta hydrolase [Paraburkholderia caribensis]
MKHWIAVGVASGSLLVAGTSGAAQDASPADEVQAKPVTHIVLVHGAFVDASSWAQVIEILQDKGYTVSAVQNPLTSLHDDEVAVRRVLERQNGPTVLVGYSWAGMPITEVGNDPKVTALVYVAALAPEVGESVHDLQKHSAAQASMPGLDAVVEDKYGNYLMDPAGYRQALAHDTPERITRVMAAAQLPMSIAAFDDKVAVAAWHTKPSWYAVSTNDQIVPPDLQEWMARRINARVVRIPSGHASILSHADTVAAMIEDAALHSVPTITK